MLVASYFKTRDTNPLPRAYQDRSEVKTFRVPNAEAVVACEVAGPARLIFREMLTKVPLRLHHETKLILFGGNLGVDDFIELAVDLGEYDEAFVVQV